MVAPVMPWYENPMFLTPAFGFLGVIVGGLLTAGSSYLLEKQREDREIQKENRIRDVNVITAARLIELELRWASAYLKVSISNKCWQNFQTAPPPGFENWEKYCEFLAPYVSHEDWRALVVSRALCVQLKDKILKAQERNDKTMSDEEAKQLTALFIERMNNARDILLRLSGGKNVEAGESQLD